MSNLRTSAFSWAKVGRWVVWPSMMGGSWSLEEDLEGEVERLFFVNSASCLFVAIVSVVGYG